MPINFQWKLCCTRFNYIFYLLISKFDNFVAAKKNDDADVGCKDWRIFTVTLAVDFASIVLPLLLIFTVSVLDARNPLFHSQPFCMLVL